MDVVYPPAIDRLPLHRRRLEAVVEVAIGEPAILGMIVGGSFASGEADDRSDLDLQVVTDDGGVDALAPRLRAIAEEAGPLAAAFTAEHVGLPHMLIVLYDDLVHVDFDPVERSGVRRRNAGLRAHVLWERDPSISGSLGAAAEEDRARELAWFEDRMWTWSWYVQTKILRGELYESLSGLQTLRDDVLFRLLAMRRDEFGGSARRAEGRVGPWASRFEATVAGLDREALMRALEATMTLYVDLAAPLLEAAGVPVAERARAVALRALEAGLAWSPAGAGHPDTRPG